MSNEDLSLDTLIELFSISETLNFYIEEFKENFLINNMSSEQEVILKLDEIFLNEIENDKNKLKNYMENREKYEDFFKTQPEN